MFSDEIITLFNDLNATYKNIHLPAAYSVQDTSESFHMQPRAQRQEETNVEP